MIDGAERIRKADIQAATARPAACEVCVEAIPAELRELPQWVCWRWQRRGGRWTKVPIDPKSGGNAKAGEPKTWSTFAQAKAFYEAGRSTGAVAGLGFEFSADDPYCGIDLDDCRDPATGVIDDWAAEIIADLDSYTEVSPSGTGVKIYVQAAKPGDRNRTAFAGGEVEIYDRERFFAVTGHQLEGVAND